MTYFTTIINVNSIKPGNLRPVLRHRSVKKFLLIRYAFYGVQIIDDWLTRNSKVRVTRHRDVAEALKNIGGIKIENCNVPNVGKYVTIYVIRNQEKYKNMTTTELGKAYQPFATGTLSSHTH